MLFSLGLWPEAVDPLAATRPMGLDLDRRSRRVCPGRDSCADRLEWIFSAMGDVFAPAVGAIAGDWLRNRGLWPGIRPGLNRTGLVAWGAGFGVALILEVDDICNPGSAPWWQSTSICGFVAAAVVYWVWATLVRERRPWRSAALKSLGDSRGARSAFHDEPRSNHPETPPIN